MQILYMSMYVCIYIYIYIYIYMYMYMYTHTHIDSTHYASYIYIYIYVYRRATSRPPRASRSRRPRRPRRCSLERGQLNENRNLMWTERGQARLISMFSTNANCEHMAYRSFRSEKCSAAGGTPEGSRGEVSRRDERANWGRSANLSQAQVLEILPAPIIKRTNSNNSKNNTSN